MVPIPSSLYLPVWLSIRLCKTYIYIDMCILYIVISICASPQSQKRRSPTDLRVALSDRGYWSFYSIRDPKKGIADSPEGCGGMSGWWNLSNFLEGSPTAGRFFPHFDEHIFPRGWFNHQLDVIDPNSWNFSGRLVPSKVVPKSARKYHGFFW